MIDVLGAEIFVLSSGYLVLLNSTSTFVKGKYSNYHIKGMYLYNISTVLTIIKG